jgi:hypothetical protein
MLGLSLVAASLGFLPRASRSQQYAQGLFFGGQAIKTARDLVRVEGLHQF